MINPNNKVGFYIFKVVLRYILALINIMLGKGQDMGSDYPIAAILIIHDNFHHFRGCMVIQV
jgi:hypothetical protein